MYKMISTKKTVLTMQGGSMPCSAVVFLVIELFLDTTWCIMKKAYILNY
ncbi:hypothetical protein [Faecalicatena contorta]|nr:hypothetical protein [Faecalicatena contorta]